MASPADAGVPPSESTQRLRVLHCLDAVREERGGVVRAVLDLCSGLAQGGRCGVTLFTADSTDAPDTWGREDGGGEDDSMPRVVQGKWPLRPWSPAGSAARDAIRQADVVHLHTPWDPGNAPLARACRRLGKPYVVSVHGMLDDWSMQVRGLKKRAYLSAVGRRMLEQAYRVHFTAVAEREQGMKWARRARPVVAPVVVDLAPYESPAAPEEAESSYPVLASGEPCLLFLSRVHPKKGVEHLVDAVARLVERGQPVQALIAGPADAAYQKQLERQAMKAGVAERVHFLGMVRGDLKLSLYSACRAFVLPTYQENFGIVLVEAMATGLPTITTRAVDIWRELEERGARIVGHSGEDVADAVADLIADPTAAATLGGRCRREVMEWLEPSRVVGEYVAMYESAIAERKG